MLHLARTRTTLVWLALIAATCFSWLLGTDHNIGSGSLKAAGAVILGVAFVKVRFVGMYFMELRNAPGPLRWLFEIYSFAVGTAVVLVYVLL